MLLFLLGCAPDPVPFSDVQEIFTNSCAYSSCHGDGGGAEGLSLSEGNAYDAIVGVPAVQNPDLNLVEPGDHAASYLWMKCANAEGIVEAPMPDGGEGLDAEGLDVLAAWIDAGALRE